MTTETKSLASRLEGVLAENNTCADCPNQRPLWASYLRWPKKGMSDESRMDDESSRQENNSEDIHVDIDGALGVVICNDCAQHHHFELGKKRSLIKYLKYSHELTARDLDILEHSGNDLVNEYYEAHLWGSFQKDLKLGDVEAEAKRRGKFIKHKYKKCLYRDHKGVAAAVQQCLGLQNYQHTIEMDNNMTANKTTISTSSKKESSDDSSKHDDQIAQAVHKIKRTKSTDSDCKRSAVRSASVSEPRPQQPSKGLMRKTASLDSDNYHYQESGEEDIPKFYNPTGKTYTEEFNLETAKEVQKEKVELLKELIEKTPPPEEEEEEANKDKGDDDDNHQGGWGIHHFKASIQVVKTKTATAASYRPRARGLAKAINANNPANMVAPTKDQAIRRGSTLAMVLEQHKSESKRKLKGLRRTASLDDESTGAVASSSTTTMRKIQQHIKALEKTKNVSLQKKPHADDDDDDDDDDDASVQSAMVETNNKSPKRGVLRRNSSLSDLEALRKSGTRTASAQSTSRRTGRKKIIDNKLKMSRSRDDAPEPKSSTAKESTETTTDPRGGRKKITDNPKSKSLDDASISDSGDAASIIIKSLKRGVLRRNSSLSDLDALKKSNESAKSTRANRSQKKSKALEARRKWEESSSRRDGRTKKSSKDTAMSGSKSSRDRSGSVSRSSRSVSCSSRRRMRRGSSLSDLSKAGMSESAILKELNKNYDGSSSSNNDGSSRRGRRTRDLGKDKLQGTKDIAKKQDAASAAGMQSDRSQRGRSTGTISRNDQPRSNSKDTGLPTKDESSKSKRRHNNNKRGSLTDLSDLQKAATAADSSKESDSEPAKLSKDRRRSRSPKKEKDNMHKSVNGIDISSKLKALPDIKPRRKDTKSVASLPTTRGERGKSKSRSPSRDRKGTRSIESRSKSPRALDMHKSLSGLADSSLKALRSGLHSLARSATVPTPTHRKGTKSKKSEQSKSQSRSTSSDRKRTRSRSPKKGREDTEKGMSGADSTKEADGDLPNKLCSVESDGDLQKKLCGGSALAAIDRIVTADPGVRLATDPRKGLNSLARSTTVPTTSKEALRSGFSHLSKSATLPAPTHKEGTTTKESLRQGIGNLSKSATLPAPTGIENATTKESLRQGLSNLSKSATLPAPTGFENTTTKESLRSKCLNNLSRSATLPAPGTTKETGIRFHKNKSRSRSPKSSFHKSMGALDGTKLVGFQRIDPGKMSNISEKISQVRTLVDASEKESKCGDSRREKKLRSATTEDVAESSAPDSAKLNDEMAEKMKQFKRRNERVEKGVRTKRDRRRSSFSGSFSQLQKDPSAIPVVLENALQGKKGKAKTKKEASGERSPRRRSNSLNDLKESLDSPEKTEERVFLRKQMNAMLDDSSGSAW